VEHEVHSFRERHVDDATERVEEIGFALVEAVGRDAVVGREADMRVGGVEEPQ
jgi:hypothetical protein